MVFGSNELPQHAFLWDQRGINGYKMRKPAAQVCHAARIGAGRQLVNIIFPNPHLAAERSIQHKVRPVLERLDILVLCLTDMGPQADGKIGIMPAEPPVPRNAAGKANIAGGDQPSGPAYSSRRLA